MKQWQEQVIADPAKKPLPVLSFPGARLIGATVRDVVQRGDVQARCMKAIADRYPTLASVSCMDLSVEAEAFGARTIMPDDDVPVITGHLIESETDVRQLAIPRPGEGRTGESIRAIELAVRQITDRPVLAGVIGPFSLAARLAGLTEIMYLATDEPEMVHALLEKTTRFLTDYVQAFRQAGSHGIVMAEPAAGLLPPDWNRDFSARYVTRIVTAVQDDDFLVVYHNCGQVRQLIPEIVATGARAFHFGNAVSLSDIIGQVPSDRLVMGNIDPAGQFTHGTPQSVADATRLLKRQMADHPNVVLSSGCDIPPQAPLANIDAFFSAAAS
ncbi:MAG: uroporphyrinogen decarboxylase family protein [Eubacteriales bacterium]|jgi:uroporphyrinogen decarboxylase|nr:uroporphyrinogen decarboxylase family protein [Eubacteriales bacterium]